MPWNRPWLTGPRRCSWSSTLPTWPIGSLKASRVDPDLTCRPICYRFGRIPWGKFKAWMEKEGIATETVAEIEQWLRREGPFYLKDLESGQSVDIPAEVLVPG
jgi:hypothetical protein